MEFLWKKTAYNSGTERHNSTKSRCVSPNGCTGIAIYFPSTKHENHQKSRSDDPQLWLWAVAMMPNGGCEWHGYVFSKNLDSHSWKRAVLSQDSQRAVPGYRGREPEKLRSAHTNFQTPMDRWTDFWLIASSLLVSPTPAATRNENSSARHAADALSTWGFNIGDKPATN